MNTNTILPAPPPELPIRSTLSADERRRVAEFCGGKPVRYGFDFPLPDDRYLILYNEEWMISEYHTEMIEQLGFLIYNLTTRGIIKGYTYEDGVWQFTGHNGEVTKSRIPFDAIGDLVLLILKARGA